MPASFLLLACLYAGLPDAVLADFEQDDYGSWKVEGTAFGQGPAQGTLPNQMEVSSYEGRGLASSYHGGDDSTGQLTSPEFTVTHNWMSFLIGGGHSPEKLAIQFVVNGSVVRSSTGPNKSPGGSEALYKEGWDVSEFRGQKAVIKILDMAKGGWGHISIDHICLTDSKPPMSLVNSSRTITISKRYLVVPIQNNAPERRVTIKVEGQEPVTNNIQLAKDNPDWLAVIDMSRHMNKSVSLTIDMIPGGWLGFNRISQSDNVVGTHTPYEEPLRGQFHFSARRGWLNDPNGLVYYKGEYHLFYQHNPYGWGWGNMHWGHATSTDLVHWTEHPIALFPDSMGTMFSGSAVVDWKNTSGFGTNKEPPMVLFYTAAGSHFVQGLAWSNDGRTFNKISQNPIIPQMEKGDRDPKVIWHEPTKNWVMVLYLEIPNKPTIQFLTSKDLVRWTPTSRIEGYHECPDLFELPIIGRPGETRWILTGANSDYQVGTFDGSTFFPETEILKGHLGRGFYAAQTFSDVPDRRIQIGWLQSETKGMPFNQSMSLPLELALVSTPAGPRLSWTPVKELQKLRQSTIALDPFVLEPKQADKLADFSSELAELNLEFKPSKDLKFEMMVRGVRVEYDAATETLDVAGHKAPLKNDTGTLDLRIFCDRNGLEIFASKGRVYVPWPYPPQGSNRRFSIRSLAGTAEVTKLQAYTLKSAWQ